MVGTRGRGHATARQVMAVVVSVVIPVLQMEHLCSAVHGRTSVKWSQPSQPRFRSPYRTDLPLMPVVPDVPAEDAIHSPAAVSIVDKADGMEAGGDEPGTQRIVLTPPHHGQRRRSKRRSRRSETASPLGRRHVYVSQDDMSRVLRRWGMSLDATGVEPFLRRFASDMNEGMVDYTEFALLVAEVLRPGAIASVVMAVVMAVASPVSVCAVPLLGVVRVNGRSLLSPSLMCLR